MAKEKKKKEEKKQIKKRDKLFQAVKGMPDILPKDQNWWRAVWQAGRDICELNDFHFIETPILEPAGLFEAGVGLSTDIVEKQMYFFKTKGGDEVVLRPELTAPIMRSYLENHLGYFSSPLKVYSCGPVFRYEKSQAGRERQFHQLDFEIIGENDSVYDVQIILVCLSFLQALKLKTPILKINTIGCRVCRPNYRQKLKDFYHSHRSKLCDDCGRRFEKNPLRLLDCKETECRALREKAPLVLDYLCQNCNNHFRGVLELVEDNGIIYDPDPFLVRGLDYYNRTVFEIFSAGNEQALCGGGRYDYLSEFLGGRPIPSIGAALGLERVISAMKAQEIPLNFKNKRKVFFAAVGDQAKKSSLKLMNKLRMSGIPVAESLGKKSLKAQLKMANRLKSPLVLIFGQKEVFEDSIIIRDMRTSAQENVILGKMIEEVRKRLR